MGPEIKGWNPLTVTPNDPLEKILLVILSSSGLQVLVPEQGDGVLLPGATTNIPLNSDFLWSLWASDALKPTG